MFLRRLAATIGIAASSALILAAPGPANAASQVGWTGPAGLSYLSNSTIINSPNLVAESKIWQTFGAETGPGNIGVRPRLFKSGVLCEARDFVYNSNPATQLVVGTSATCGSGSYNSHGFVNVWNATNFTFDQYVTFPSNPLNWTDPTARSSVTPPIQSAGTNARGESFGTAEGVNDETEIPDLVQAYATNGSIGFIRSDDLQGPEAQTPSEALAQGQSPRTVNVYDSEGSNVVGQFTFGDN